MTMKTGTRWPSLATAIVLATGIAILAVPAGAAPPAAAQKPALTKQLRVTQLPVVPNPRPVVQPPVMSRKAPPLPSVRTSVEPGNVDIEKLNARVKDPNKLRAFTKKDRQKFGLASSEERGHGLRMKR